MLEFLSCVQREGAEEFPHLLIEGDCLVMLSSTLALVHMSWVWCPGTLDIKEVFFRHGIQILAQIFQAHSKCIVDCRVNALGIVAKSQFSLRAKIGIRACVCMGSSLLAVRRHGRRVIEKGKRNREGVLLGILGMEQKRGWSKWRGRRMV